MEFPPKSRYSSFKIVLVYVVVSVIYIFTSDYILETVIRDIDVLSRVQTFKAIIFIILTSTILYSLIKRNIQNTTSYYRQLLNIQETSEIKVKKSEEDYLSLFNHSPLPMWIFDTKTLEILRVNEAACINYGYSSEDYRTMTLRDIRPVEDIQTMQYWVDVSTKNDRYDLPETFRHKKKSGEIILVKIQTSFVTFKGRKARLASAVDVTEEINLQRNLIEINERLKIASEIANLGYWSNDLITNKIQWSDELYKIFEVSPESFELNLDNIIKLYHPEEWDNFDIEDFSDFKSNKIKERESRIITGTGKHKWILERQFFLTDNNGKPVQLNGIAVDITRRKLQTQELFESNERFKILTKATVEAIIDWDLINNQVLWGEGFHTMLGYDLNKADIHLWDMNIHPDDRNWVMKELQECIDNPHCEHFNKEFRFIRANGSVAYMQHKGIFIRNSEGKAVRAVAAMVDMTETNERIQRIERQNQALKEIGWTQSHVVRAPLANLLGLVSLLKENNFDENQRQEFIKHIDEAAHQLDAVIHDIVQKTQEVEDTAQ